MTVVAVLARSVLTDMVVVFTPTHALIVSGLNKNDDRKQ